MARVLVVDDDHAIRETVALALAKAGYQVERVASAGEARRRLAALRIDLVVCDIYMPGEDGLELLAELRRERPGLPVILMTARGSVETVALAARIGAFAYLAKPFDLSALLARVHAALEPLAAAPAAPPDTGPASMIVGSHPSIVEVYKAVARVAPLPLPVLLLGETGTGKELVAKALHRLSNHPDGPFVPVNCGAIPDPLLEAELFGFVRGAFTDARRDRRGVLTQAHRGTVLLDEIGEISPAFQVKLLRFLEAGGVRPLGAETGETVAVRVVAAPQREQRRQVAARKLREDLYYRLAGYEIRLPPLRERLADLPLLVDHFRRTTATELGFGAVPAAAPEVLARLAAYPWPGNVRELEQVVRRALVDGRTLADPALVERILAEVAVPPVGSTTSPTADTGEVGTLREAERRRLVAVLDATSWNRTAAARILGIERKTLGRKLKRLGIRIEDELDAGRDES